MECNLSAFLILSTFAVGYLLIALESYVKVNKAAIAIALAAACWLLIFLGSSCSLPENLTLLSEYLGDVSQIIFFLLGAMTLVELIDSHKGFQTVTNWIHTKSKRKLLFVVSLTSFFLSAILDNLTTTILMISIVRKLIPVAKERIYLGCMIVIAANAGGAWTPIGDVTTTMLWIGERLTSFSVMKEIFLPSFISMAIPMIWFMKLNRGEYLGLELEQNCLLEKSEPGAQLVFFLGFLAFLSVPVIKWATGLPPFMGMLIGVALLWIITDILHHKHEERQHLRVPHILTKIDVSTILFFLGILLTIDALEAVGLLKRLAVLLGEIFPSPVLVASAIGVISAIIDNVPLVAASIGMYDLTVYPLDDPFWLLVAFTAGTGGSMLSIGSAAGVALMGIEKVDFITYAKKATIPTLLGFLAGIFIYVLLSR